MPTVKLLPYVEPHANDHFDQHQFNSRSLRVQARFTPQGWETTGLNFGDPNHLVRRKVARSSEWIPAFAANQTQLRHVIAQRAWHYTRSKCGRASQVPKNLIDDWKQLRALTDERLKWETSQHSNHAEWQRHVFDVQRIGGYLAFLSAIAYRSWLLGWTSTAVAESLQIMPTTVRQQVYRLRNTAVKLGYDIGRIHHSRLYEKGWQSRHVTSSKEVGAPR